MKELYKKHRPKTLQGVVGQESAVASLQKLIDKDKIPHCLLLIGPSGCGKTTIARILQTALKCGDADFQEINCADFKGIDTIREIRKFANLSPMDGENRVWLIDECHMLTKDAQNAFLKLLEDTPRRTYFILATTDPQKLIPTVMTRSTEVKLDLLSPKALVKVVQRVLDKEKVTISEDVMTEVVDAAAGSARKALVVLQQIIDIEGEEAQLSAIRSTTINKDQGIALARVLHNPRAQWSEAAAILKEFKEDPEGVRYLVLSYATSILIKGGPLSSRAFKVIDIFGRNFYDSKKAGLVAACYETICMK